MTANRNIVYDILSGIFILRMVYTHSCMYAEQSSHTFLFNLTGMFLMWFFFKGGLLAKKGCNVLDAITPLSKKLLKPFIFLTLVAVLMDSALYLIDIANTFGNTKYEYDSCKCIGIGRGDGDVDGEGGGIMRIMKWLGLSGLLSLMGLLMVICLFGFCLVISLSE